MKEILYFRIRPAARESTRSLRSEDVKAKDVS
jgi:hypothetical protein